jgi:molybdate/tungstate transport system substrate-binding protein
MQTASALSAAAAIAVLLGGPLSGHPRHGSSPADTLVVFNAGSLARPLKAALDSFSARRETAVQQENAGSLETVRKLIDLNRIPDVIALADDDLFPQLLMPGHVTWYARFARNRMVITYTDRSRDASRIAPNNWWQVLTQPGVQIGRSDPNLDPAGYRALIVFQLAERWYRHPGLAAMLIAATPPRNMRPKSAELTALVETGELDYAWEYESVAQAAGLRYVQLPHQLDLSEPADSAFYAQARVRVLGTHPGDTIEARGAPIISALSIPLRAPHAQAAERFVAYLLSEAGRRVLRAQQLPVLDHAVIVGTGAPAAVAAQGADHSR